MPPILVAEDVHAGYSGRPVLLGVSLQVDVGGRLLLMGPNGCGKTTLLRVLAGQIKPSRGRVRYRGQALSVDHRSLGRRARLGYLLQSRNIFSSRTVEENLELAFWMGPGDYVTRRDAVLQFFPLLRPLLMRRAGLLSGGERQSLATAMVLIRPVELVLLDEPTAGLAPKAAASLLAAVGDAQKELGLACVLVEHNLQRLRRWATEVIVLKAGQVVARAETLERLLEAQTLQSIYFE